MKKERKRERQRQRGRVGEKEERQGGREGRKKEGRKLFCLHLQRFCSLSHQV
jgi:hypothetical protein